MKVFSLQLQTIWLNSTVKKPRICINLKNQDTGIKQRSIPVCKNFKYWCMIIFYIVWEIVLGYGNQSILEKGENSWNILPCSSCWSHNLVYIHLLPFLKYHCLIPNYQDNVCQQFCPQKTELLDQNCVLKSFTAGILILLPKLNDHFIAYKG